MKVYRLDEDTDSYDLQAEIHPDGTVTGTTNLAYHFDGILTEMASYGNPSDYMDAVFYLVEHRYNSIRYKTDR